MHVAIDGVGNHVGGGWTVLVRTIAEMLTDRRVERITVFCSPLDLVASPPPLNPRLHWVEHGREHRLPRARLAWFSVGLDTEVDRVGADVVLSMNGVGRTHRPRVCVIQQAFAVAGRLRRVRPRTLAAKLALIRRETARSARDAAAVVVQSTWMKSNVVRSLGIEAHTLPIGLPRAREIAPRGVGEGLLVVGSDLDYKRRDVATDAAEIARRKYPDLDLTIVDGVAPARVDALLERAAMLLVPSDIESFGLPIVEAFAAGCPVVLCDRPWARAVADNGAIYFDAGSPTSAARRIIECLAEPALADDVRQRGDARLAALWAQRPYAGLVDLLAEVA